MKESSILKSLREKVITEIKSAALVWVTKMKAFKVLGDHFKMAEEISDEELVSMFDPNKITSLLVTNPIDLEKNFRNADKVQRKKKRIVF